jgi:prevent-host-death family protein
MGAVGIRELRQRASELLRRVEQGETIEVTDRGRPVALLSPVPAGTRLERLRALGDVEVATHDFDDLAEPLVLPGGVEPPSAVLARLRDHER